MEFARDVPRVSGERDHLTRIFERLGAPSVDLAAALLERYPRETLYERFYFWTDGRAGHFTPEANRVVARILRDAIDPWSPVPPAEQPAAARRSRTEPTATDGYSPR